MKKAIYLLILIAFTSNISAQFAAVLSKDGFTRLENDSILLAPDENLRGTFEWQKSTDSSVWTEVEANLSGNTLGFAPNTTEVYRLQIIEGTCSAIYSDTIKVFSKHTTISGYLSAGISIPDLVTGGVTVDDLLAAGVTVNDLLTAGVALDDLFNAGIMVGTLVKEGADLLELANAGLIGTLTDYDGTDYEWVKIGEQIWMAENLKTTHYANGDAIPLIESTSGWDNLGVADEAYCFYDNSSANGTTYGAIYSWEAARKSCPSGWHLPTSEEWKQLEMYLGMSESAADDKDWRGTNEGSKLAGNSGLWGDVNLTNNAAFGVSGFNALPGGYRHYYGNFYFIGSAAYFWSGTEYNASNAWYHNLYSNGSSVNRSYLNKAYGRSVRCVKD